MGEGITVLAHGGVPGRGSGPERERARRDAEDQTGRHRIRGAGSKADAIDLELVTGFRLMELG